MRKTPTLTYWALLFACLLSVIPFWIGYLIAAFDSERLFALGALAGRTVCAGAGVSLIS